MQNLIVQASSRLEECVLFMSSLSTTSFRCPVELLTLSSLTWSRFSKAVVSLKIHSSLCDLLEWMQLNLAHLFGLLTINLKKNV